MADRHAVRWRIGVAIAALVTWAAQSTCVPAAAEGGDPQAWFNKGLQLDLDSAGPDAARVAFSWYRKAALAGLPEAEFNVAVMLDSGRGVSTDLVEAALWYARAASHGNERAAYNLGQLYEQGQGVPQNLALARAWFGVSGLPAARSRAARLSMQRERSAILSPPVPLSPVTDAVAAGGDGLELVWTAKPQPGDTRFYVELQKLGAKEPQEVFAGFADTSAVFVGSAKDSGDYAWRVMAVSKAAGRYAASAWVSFSVPPSAVAAQAPPP